MNIHFENIEAVQNALENLENKITDGMQSGLERAGAEVEKYAKAECPVDTGHLHDH